jgi:uroporphyrinogen-III synthase
VDAPARLLAALADGVDAITLTSGSTARHLAAALGGRPLPPGVAVACIGPQTAAEAASAGLLVSATAATHTAAGLVDALSALLGAAQPLP